jgi:hypothetical protein
LQPPSSGKLLSRRWVVQRLDSETGEEYTILRARKEGRKERKERKGKERKGKEREGKEGRKEGRKEGDFFEDL